MPSLATIRATNIAAATAAFMTIRSKKENSLGSFPTPSRPVGVFVGGTAGIGEAMARKFAEHAEGNADVVIVGRNKQAAEEILASLPRPKSSEPDVGRVFVECDATLMKNVNSASQEILSKFPKINYLVISTGLLTLAGRTETSEGIDRKLALHYYSRWNFIRNLVGAVNKASEGEEHTAIMSVLAPSHGGDIRQWINDGDLGLVKSYSVKNAAMASPTYNDLMMESFAETYPAIRFIHAHPGFVRTGIAASSDTAVIRFSSILMSTLGRLFSASPEECAESMWNAVYTTAQKPGPWRTGWWGEDLGNKRYYGDETQRKKLWEHTEEVVRKAVGFA